MVDYVEELKKDFSLTKSELNGVQKKMARKYQSKIPASLSSQFPDRVNKNDAVDKYREKQEREPTKLHPVGKIWTQLYYSHTCTKQLHSLYFELHSCHREVSCDLTFCNN